jgi:PEP-CTERM motif
MCFKHKAALAAATTATALWLVAGTAQAAFQGRLANGTPSATCTASGANKCTYFFDTTLNITILNNWNIGSGSWSASAAPGSAQALAASAGLTASGLAGWVLPTGDGGAAAGALNQYKSIWTGVGSSFAGLSGQFDGVQTGNYWSGTVFAPNPSNAWSFNTISGNQNLDNQGFPLFAVAVRPGDVAAAIPEPQTYALMLMGVGVVLLAQRKRTR